MQITTKTLAFLGDPRHAPKTAGHASSLTLFSERIGKRKVKRARPNKNVGNRSHFLPITSLLTLTKPTTLTSTYKRIFCYQCLVTSLCHTPSGTSKKCQVELEDCRLDSEVDRSTNNVHFIKFVQHLHCICCCEIHQGNRGTR